MTTNRSPISGRRRHLTLPQRWSLTGGASMDPDAFHSDQERREAWERWRDYFLAPDRCRFGKRPQAWWDYDAPIAKPEDDAFEAATLHQAGLLGEDERAELEKYWRARFEQSFEPHFGVSLRPGEWLNGDDAKERHYRTYGILPELVRKWTAERRRREQQIADLQSPKPAA
jgi:hypothetical protein